MSDINNGGPAFPPQDRSFVIQADVPLERVKETLSIIDRDRQIGMSLRDYFAAQALTVLCQADGVADFLQDKKSRLAEHCYAIADAMLKAREEQS
jgi:hypothetical protein